jgi:hypothetical protein
LLESDSKRSFGFCVFVAFDAIVSQQQLEEATEANLAAHDASSAQSLFWLMIV